MNEKKIEYLLKYLELLLKAQEDGYKLYQEIGATTKAISAELGMLELLNLSKSDGSFIIRENGEIHMNGRVVISSEGIIADSARGVKATDTIVSGLKKLGVSIK